MQTFNDRVAVVTGAASGIGRALAETFIQAGMKVVLADVDEKTLELTVENLKAKGATVLGVLADVSKADQVASLAEKTVSAFGAVHVLCNNAGVVYNQPNSWEIPLKGWEWVMGVNLMGVVHGVHYFLPIMLAQDTEAHIVNTASVSGLLNDYNTMLYSVSKHAVVALSENLYMELRQQEAKVGVSLLCPGPTDTDIHASIERTRPDDVPPTPELTKEREVFLKAHQTWIKRGLAPLEVARQVLSAIRQKQFYILPHDVRPAIEQRLHHLIHQENPQAPPPPEGFLSIIEEITQKGT